MVEQRVLSKEQLSDFYIEEFVGEQKAHISRLLKSDSPDLKVVDVGGGAGFLASALGEELGLTVTVWDIDAEAIRLARLKGVNAIEKNILTTIEKYSVDVMLFNLVLHHLVGSSNRETLATQKTALENAKCCTNTIIVHEYIYESYFFDGLSSYLIWLLTSSTSLVRLLAMIGKIIPSLNANTIGVGVRFNCKSGWRRLFQDAGFRIVNSIDCQREHVSFPRRILLIRNLYRTTFLLEKI